MMHIAEPQHATTQTPHSSTHLQFVWVAVDVQRVVLVPRENPLGVLHGKPGEAAGGAAHVPVVWTDDGPHIGFVRQQAVVAVGLLLHDLVEDVDQRRHGRKVGVGVVPSHTAVVNER